MSGKSTLEFKKAKVEKVDRVDPIVTVRQEYEGDLDRPRRYNQAFASVLRKLADQVEKVGNAWVTPDVSVWLHEHGVAYGEVVFSPLKNSEGDGWPAARAKSVIPKRVEKQRPPIDVKTSTGNVFAHIGLPDADRLLAHVDAPLGVGVRPTVGNRRKKKDR